MPSWCRSFADDTRGNIAAIFGLTLLPVATMVGAGVDYSRVVTDRGKLQAATDRAALAALSLNANSDQQRIDIAVRSLEASGFPGGSATMDENTIRVSATKSVKTAFMGVIGRDTIDVTARSAAAMAEGTGSYPACVLALDPTATSAIAFTGNASFTGINCGVQANSTANPALSVAGSSTVRAASICAVGTATQGKADAASPQVKSGCTAIPDPLASLPRPNGTGSCSPDPDLKPNKTAALPAGIYCGGLDVKGTVSLVDGGVYVIRDGPLRVNSNAEMTGKNVFFYLTGSGAELRINGGATLNLSAPTSGDYKGVLIYQDPSSTNVADNDLNGNATSVLSGIVYAPRYKLTISGNTTLSSNGEALALVASRIEFTGSAVVKTDVQPLVLAGAPLGRSRTMPVLTQ